MAQKGEKYTKGTIVGVLATDAGNGTATDHIERDSDGALWRVKDGSEPEYLRDESDVRAALAEYSAASPK